MSMMSKFKNFFALEDEYDYVDEQEEYEHDDEIDVSKQPKAANQKQNIVSLQSVQKSSKVVLIEPRAYSEVQDIADQLKNRRSVVVNLQRNQHDQAKRIVDFLSGTVYALGGDIQKVGSNIFLCTPDNVDVSGTISELSIDEDSIGQRW
ncbi:cell division protein SepF [Cytobacillus sp. IB215665]|uniref:cell division protein SepF n=1 Tax=Cytobacillus sp. IB215665 TaxID=3097357 RepID=UPI002A122FF7|nr:cell division protein SepF [Cytobacillus sp. IB215665]MDX8364986.1 cell division protein SepF [Cytobacillus sp. IB215665]